MRLVILLSFSILISLTYSCNRAKSINSRSTKKLILYTEDSAVKVTHQELFLNNLAKLMGLKEIKNGNQSFYLRVWLWPGKESGVINIERGQNESNCELIEFKSVTKNNAEYISIDSQLANLKPRSGWDNFFKKMDELRIPYLESGTIQKTHRMDLTESSYVQFEIASPGKYHFYEYLQPSYYKTIDKNSASVDSFLHCLDSELGIDLYQRVSENTDVAK